MRMSADGGLRRQGATIDGVVVTALLAYGRAGHGTKGV
jgi:hypothetical protein